MVTLDTARGGSAAEAGARGAPREGAGGVFPVYGDLVQRLLRPQVDPATGAPDPVVAHLLAVCSSYAYSDLSTMAQIMARMGLEECRCLGVSFHNDPMFVASTAYLVQSLDGRVVILVYRGTEPVNLVNWLTDLDAAQVKVRLDVPGGAALGVHPGFYRNVRATRFEIAEALRCALEGRPVTEPALGRSEETVHPMEALYVAGHSLGGAMAAIMGALLRLDPLYEARFDAALRSVYTYGQPMVGEPELAEVLDAEPDIGGRLFRYLYEGDPVPGMPSRDTGRWAHFGHEQHFRTGLDGSQWHEATRAGQIRFAGQLAVAFSSLPLTQLLALQRVPFLYRIDDHRPHHYVSRLAPPGVVTELGDHELVYEAPLLTRLRRSVEHWGRQLTQLPPPR